MWCRQQFRAKWDRAWMLEVMCCLVLSCVEQSENINGWARNWAVYHALWNEWKPDCIVCRVERLFGLLGAMEPMSIELDWNGAMEPMRFGSKWGDGTHGAMEPIETGQTAGWGSPYRGQIAGWGSPYSTKNIACMWCRPQFQAKRRLD